MNALRSGESFLCLAIKISSWINIILTLIQEDFFIVYTKFFTVSPLIYSFCNIFFLHKYFYHKQSTKFESIAEG